MSSHVVIVFHSGYGHRRRIAQAVAAGAFGAPSRGHALVASR
jgi:hypothetical protein